MTTGTDTMGNVLGALLGTLTDTGTSPVKVVRLLDTVIGTDTTETVDGVGLVGFVDADPEAWVLVESVETGKGGFIAAVVDVPEDWPVFEDPWL